MQVQWDREEVKAVYEDMVSVLIKRLHPTASRVDGSGGDGGRDLQVRTDDGNLVIYELKSFSGRLNRGGRKKQIERSLARAKDLKPAEWHLVAPLDLTTSERDWFEDLTSSVPFDCDWAGKTWLDGEMSRHPEIPGYYLEDGNKRVIDLLIELRAEWDPSDAFATMSRVGKLRERLNEFDPHYRYDFLAGRDLPPPLRGVVLSVGHDDTRVDVHPRYPSAPEDRPITVTVRVQAGEADAIEALRQALDYGEEAELPIGVVDIALDAPGGLGGEFPDSGLRVRGLTELLDGDILVLATILAEDGQTLVASLELEATSRRMGHKGGVMTAVDRSGLVTLELHADKATGRFRANFRYHFVDVEPAAGLACARWLDHLGPPNLLRLELNDHIVGEPFRLGESLVPDSPLELLEAFQEVQAQAGRTFPVPADLTLDEWRAIRLARRSAPTRGHHRLGQRPSHRSAPSRLRAVDGRPRSRADLARRAGRQSGIP